MNLLENAVAQGQWRIEYMIGKYQAELTYLQKGVLIPRRVKSVRRLRSSCC
mgnify:FL=1